MITRLASALIAATVLATPVFAQSVPASRIAVVDAARIGRECTACRSAISQLQSQESAFRTRAQTLQQQLQTEGRPLETAVNALGGKQPDAALQARIKAFQAKESAAQQELANGQRNLQSTQTHVNQQIGVKLIEVAGTVAQQRGANLAVDKGSTLFSAAALDITDSVLAALNQQLPSVRVTPLPQQPAPAGR